VKRTEHTYGQLDQALRSLGFSCRPSAQPPPGRVYEHKEAGALIILPAFPKRSRVFAYHFIAVQIQLDNFGVATPEVFAAKLQQARRKNTKRTKEGESVDKT
jgi:hypothetical protein